MDAQQFEEMVEINTSFVYNIAYRMMGNTADAEDIVQDTFLQVYRSVDSFRGESAVSTWLYRIAVNACLMKLRKEKRSRQLTATGYEDEEVLNWLPGPERETPERVALNSELRREVQEGITLLPEDLRAAVVLRDIQELSTTEATEVLGITVASLKARLHRGRVLLRKYLEGYIKGSSR